MGNHRVEFLPLSQGDKKREGFAVCGDHSCKTVKARRVLGHQAPFDVSICREFENVIYHCVRQTWARFH